MAGNKKTKKAQLAKRKGKARLRDTTSLIPRKYQNAMWDIGTKAAMRGASWLICNKYKDQNLNTAPPAAIGEFNTTGAFYLVNYIEQGLTTNTREGKTIHLKSLYLRATILGTAVVSHNRLCIVRAKGSADTSSAANFTTALFDASGGYSGSSLYAPIDHGRFEILYDRMFTTMVTSDTRNHHIETTIPLNNMRINYIENLGYPSNDEIFVYAVGSVAATSDVQLQGFTRLLYTDG